MNRRLVEGCDLAGPANNALLRIRDLRTHFRTEAGVARAVDGVDLDIMPGQVLGLVGESGSGKSVTALSVMRLVPDPPGRIVSGSIMFRGRDLLGLSWNEIRDIRGKEIGMIFQEPMTSLNPVYTVGMQLTEVILRHEDCSKGEARNRSVDLLHRVGIPDPARRLQDYPQQFSGGMRQRVMIAMALACNPSLLIADEPTTALDVTIQAQILELMLELREQQPGAAILLITHNLAVVAETCDRVAVMYGGRMQEVAPVRELFRTPLHPYTKGLLASLPELDGERARRLTTIPGNVPNIHELPVGCKFASRCSVRLDHCASMEPDLREVAPGHLARCHLLDTAGGRGADVTGPGSDTMASSHTRHVAPRPDATGPVSDAMGPEIVS